MLIFLENKQLESEVVAQLLAACDKHYWGKRSSSINDARIAAGIIVSGGTSCRIVVCYEDDHPVGFATYAILYPGVQGVATLFMKDLFVTEKARGHGIGKALLLRLREIAEEHGCARFDWTSETTNDRAAAFYRGLGAEIRPEKIYWRMNL